MNKDYTIKLEALEEHAPIEDAGDIEHVKEVSTGSIWGWCTVKITVTHIPTGIEGESFLGCCSYGSKEDFKNNSRYYSDMILSCLDEIREVITKAQGVEVPECLI